MTTHQETPVPDGTQQEHTSRSRPDGPAPALARAQALLASLVPGGSVTPVAPGADVIDTTVPVPMLNGLVLTAAGHERADLDRALADAATRLPTWSMQVVGHSPTRAERSVAADHGLRELRRPTMVRSLADLPEPDGAALSSATFRMVRTPEDRAAFTRVLDESFGTDDSHGRPFVTDEVLAHPAARVYVAVVDGQVAATGLSWLDEQGWLGIYSGGTVPALRRRGLGRALLLHRLAEGRRAGAHTAYLQSSAMGRSLHEKLGFVDSGDDVVYFTR
ncbi:GNAT family N-acetyltransferase [Promicromonospora sp. NPDC019610]|uniref:GNAT family N-acetyltransferase n=1 Tax=Promicromonospora sp. NPDC019610 TaxID=3364405 RepID=UPI0037902339